MEHTSHHPPISHFLINDFDNQYKYFGHYEYKASLRGNALVGKQEGPNKVLFKDGQEIVFMLPPIKISGLLFGTRIIELYENITFRDEKNDLICKLQFYEGGGFFQSRLHPSDYFEFSFLISFSIILFV